MQSFGLQHVQFVLQTVQTVHNVASLNQTHKKLCNKCVCATFSPYFNRNIGKITFFYVFFYFKAKL